MEGLQDGTQPLQIWAEQPVHSDSLCLKRQPPDDQGMQDGFKQGLRKDFAKSTLSDLFYHKRTILAEFHPCLRILP